MKTTTLENAEKKHLEFVETCDNQAGYPRGIKQAFIGFENFANAEDFAEENNCDVVLLKIRAGHQFYYDMGKCYKPLTYNDYLNDLGENYREFDFNNEFAAALENMPSDSSFEDYIELIEKFSKFKFECDMLDEESVLIYNGYTLQEFPKETMRYSEDVYTYVIGVVDYEED